MESCTYEDFIHYLDILDNHQSKLLFNSMNENPVREEYVKSSDNVIVDQTVTLKTLFLLCQVKLTVENTTNLKQLIYSKILISKGIYSQMI